jgi:hypothetical protein
MLPLFRECERFAYAGYTVALVQCRVDKDFAAVAKRGRRWGDDFLDATPDGGLMSDFHRQPWEAVAAIKRLIDAQIRTEDGRVIRLSTSKKEK